MGAPDGWKETDVLGHITKIIAEIATGVAVAVVTTVIVKKVSEE